MKSLLLLLCCLGVLAELRATHVVGLPDGGPQFSHLPDESNFQASGGAALGSFGGFTRVIVLLVVLLGVLYHGFVPTGMFGPEASVRRSTTRLPIRKLSESREEHAQIVSFTSIVQAKADEVATELRAETNHKISKQTAKKQAKKAAKKLLESVKAVEEKKAAVAVVESEKIVVAEQEQEKTINENVIVEAEPNVEAAVTEKETVTDNEKDIVTEKEGVENLAIVDASLQENSRNAQAHGKEKEMATIMECEDEGEIMIEEEATRVPREHMYLNEEEERQQEDELVMIKMDERNKKGWVSNPHRVNEKTSATIKRARRMLSVLESRSVKEAAGEDEADPWGSGLDDLDFDSFVADPRTATFPMYGGPLFLEDSSPLDIAGLESPASIEPVRDKAINPLMVREFVPKNKAPEFVLLKGPESAPTVTYTAGEGPRDWAFNSHKKTAWMQKQSRANWPTDPLAIPNIMSVGVPWSPIRTPCKFASGCKKPGCQFTHPSIVPASFHPVF